MSNATSWPAPDPHTRRRIPETSRPLDRSVVERLLAAEWERFRDWSAGSGRHNVRAGEALPLGVTSSFQHWDPWPITITSARGAHLTDVDGNRLLDLSMGFGAMLVGHLNPVVVDAVKHALDEIGTLFVTPSSQATDMAERFKTRFGLDMLRFTNSGTESLMYAIRSARAFTGRKAIIKIEGGYHGGYDPLQVSVKPGLDEIGPADNPTPATPFDVEAGTVHVVAYNDLGQLERVLSAHGTQIACLVVEPVIENLAIVLPDEGYLAGVRRLCDDHGVVLIFDEVKTGLTAGHGGASQRLGVKPDLVTLAKSIGGGLPLAAFGGKREVMEVVVDGRMAHFGTYNGNALCMAAAEAVDELCTHEALAAAEQVNLGALEAIDTVIDEYELPAHTVGVGLKGCVTWSTSPVRNYRDYKATDFGVAELSWLWGVNRGILTPPGLDEQWLVSLAHTTTDMDQLVGDVRELAKALRG
ncbi:MAG TPA: aminotransferase class III-fold pyridoxal phosphate-dependent enzyme [Phycicoccus elongatus]|uniref:aspartate aminotransferase family protein n=1 Tax=Phycicoccus TaxID=367298 RepID=UPI002590181D|nr:MULTISPECIES: aminotransferase class III-fold pyridoxal phosphate-dependent enzyme [Phycicoccus]MCB9406050.1 aminotransferase class III-fold pyridoxal phosphate-dependent enzyme [Tetrasphaera sp.]MCO5301944.1 aminotransferase class III-fold pyridoxal phosphate-dependent enzyme [Phycicoccus sp.]HPF77066.1 aminotransferase class III-fold pyridoxal phosphate-dependent enzyme [Phycicoccus elongatus]HPK12540.1 aminotransferase class III-fold pyridoxal phosphate-dependent enzyme [Phycicoccus elong